MNAFDALEARGANRVVAHAPLGPRTTYRVGGSVRMLVTLESEGDLEELGPLLLETGVEIVAVGNGSNLLVADGEHEVVAVHLTGEFATVSWREVGREILVDAGAGLDLPRVARQLASEGIVGLEWAVGVPGTVGGAVAMNAGGHGADLAASLENAVVWRRGSVAPVSKGQLELGYRSSSLARGDVVLSATLRLGRGEPQEANTRVHDVVRWRREHQPGGQNAGSVFQNPPGDFAARLIDAAGCRGLRYESAQVSEKHANFIQADPHGRANDVYELLSLVRARVFDHSGVALVSEHRFVGFGTVP